MSQGPTGKPLHAVFKTMETLEFQDELGRTVLQVCQVGMMPLCSTSMSGRYDATLFYKYVR